MLEVKTGSQNHAQAAPSFEFSKGGAPTQRPYQIAATAASVAARRGGLNRILIKKPTGTGKTVWFADLLNHLGDLQLEKGRGAVLLVIAHREELLDQAAAKIRAAHRGLVVDVEQGDRKASRYSDVVVASIQTLAAMKFRRLERLMAAHDFRLVVVDEAHHSAATTYRGALARLGFLPAAEAEAGADTGLEAASYEDVDKMAAALEGWDARAPKDRLLIGVTATPNRSDAIGLGCVFQSIAYSYALKDAINDGWLVPIVPWVVESRDSLDAVKTTAGDFNQRALAQVVNNERRNQLGVAAWQEYAQGRQTIAFTVDVAHAHSVADAFERQGVSARAVSGETPKDDRRQILRQFSEGQIQVVSNCMVLTEGTDLPCTGAILHLKPTQSPTLYEQMTGRGLRLFPGKPDCIVIDVVDLSRRHSLQAAPMLYGLPPSLTVKGKDLRQVEREVDELRALAPGLNMDTLPRMTLEQLRAKAQTFDIWTVPALGDFGVGLTMGWIKVGDEYRLQYPWADGIEIITVGPDLLGHFGVTCTLRPKDGGPARQSTKATQVVTAQAAAALAEAYIAQERPDVMKLTDTSQPWRAKPASEKQIALLHRLRAPVRPGLTSGEASQMIDLAMARRKR